MSSLTISRNKHWRYISAFHGPWLQLPPEILETLAHSNYLSPRPRQTDPSVLYDLLKVRKLVDEAADLAVRAQNGTASSAIGNDNGLPGAALGLNARGGAGANAKLSPERKYRMRELATQKLSQAYRLDEVAASVATMQSASALDAVAWYVLQRAPQNSDAQYVNFFHEKIPSRMMAQCTPLEPLNHVITREPGHAAPYRTRALTKIFKEDHIGAAQDLSEALLLCRNEQTKHIKGKNQLITQKQAQEDVERRKVWTKDWMQENKVLDEDQPRGLEMQLLFQRGNQYLTIASHHVKGSLEAFRVSQRLQREREAELDQEGGEHGHPEAASMLSSEEHEAYKRGLESRELVRKYAKRALRDYTTFLSNLDYAVAANPHASTISDAGRIIGHVNGDNDQVSPTFVDSPTSPTLVHRPRRSSAGVDDDSPNDDAEKPPIIIHDLATMLSPKTPNNIPPFPISTPSAADFGSPPGAHSVHQHEMLTYHPLLPETLHSSLLTHCLLQTAPTTLHRIANNVARLTRLADGYPFFLSARSPARADWSEILRQASNWISLGGTWDQLCRSDLLKDNMKPGKRNVNSSTDIVSKAAAMRRRRPAEETPMQKRERIHKEAVMEALGDERVVDDESFQKAVKAREQRAFREQGLCPETDRADRVNGSHDGETSTRLATVECTNDSRDGAQTNGYAAKEPNDTAKEVSQEPVHVKQELRGQLNDGSESSNSVARDEEYLIGTERATRIAQWVTEAPANPMPVDGTAKPKKKRKPAAKRGTLSQQSSDVSTMTESTLPD
ncbi:MAG: hypothetical protein Q9159_004324 [Coniocarpon cinnabarinum]